MRVLSSDEISLVSGAESDTGFSHGDLHIYPWMPPPHIPYLPAIPYPPPIVPAPGAPTINDVNESYS